MPCFSLLASKLSPLGNGAHREYLEAMVQLIRNGSLWPSCTSKVLTSGTFVVERQYASKVSCSQFWGTPLLSGGNARVTESRTVIRTVSFCGAAFANTAASKRLACKAAILRILIQPSPPNSAHISVAYLAFPNDSGGRSRSCGTFCSPWRVQHNSSPGGTLGEQALLRAIARMEPAHRFFVSQCLNLHRPFQSSDREPLRDRFGPAGDCSRNVRT